jgi:hypothetical protein
MKNTLKSLISTTMLIGSTQVLAATSGSLVITGTVTEVVSASITGNQNSFAIQPGSAIAQQNIGTININSNDPNGYTVSLSSSRDGSKLANAGNNEFIAYSVKYNSNDSINLSTSGTVVEDVTSQTQAAVARSLTLDIAANNSLGRSAEAYSDVITVTITGK